MAWSMTGNIKGPKGDKGDPGDDGAPGEPGADSTVAGPPGARGSKWFSGTGAPSGVTGSAPGDYYLDTASGDVYELV